MPGKCYFYCGMKQMLPILLLLLCQLSLSAQPAFSFDHPVLIDDEDGLPSKQVNALVQDQRGFVWIGTREGLARFDGHRLEIFQHRRSDPNSLPSNRVETLLVDHQNRLWVGTGGGLCYYSPQDKNFRRFPEAGLNVDPTLFSSSRVICLYQDRKKNIWMGFPDKLLRYDPHQDSIRTYHFSATAPDSTFDVARVSYILHIAQDPLDSNAVWLGSLSGLMRLDVSSGDYQWFPQIMDNKDRQYLANSIKLLHALPDGSLLIGSWAGAYRFHPQDGVYEEIGKDQPDDETLTRSFVLSFLSVPESEQVGISYGQGFAWYRPQSRKLTSLLYNNANEGQIYSAHFMDEQHRLWGMSDQGLYLYNPLINRIRRYDFPFRQRQYRILPRAMVESKYPGRIYVASLAFNGLIVWDLHQNRWSVIPPPAGTTWEVGLQDMIRLENGRIILLGPHSLFELLEDQQRIVPLYPQIDFGTPAFRRVVEGAPDELWVGSRRAGLFRLNLQNGQMQVYTHELDKEPNDTRHRWIETLYKDSRGQIWIRTAFEYSVYLPEQDRFYHWDSYGRDSTQNFPLVMAFQEDRQGRMWMAGDQFGLAMASIDEVEKGVQKVVANEADGPVRNVANLGLDHQGYLWLEHENGITRYQPDSGQSRYFSPGYGVPPTVNDLFTSLKDGQMVLGIPGGMALFRPEDLLSNEELPVPYITSFKVFDQQPSKLNPVELLEEIDLSYRQNFFSFEFSALAFNLPDQVRFRYRLVGFDPQWNEAGMRRYASYTNIPGGDYVFELQAANNEGVWNGDNLRIPIHITTPWWKAYWFWLPVSLFSLSSVAFAVRWRIRQVRQQEKIKSDFDQKLTSMELHALRAQMNPHFIFNCLNSIDYYIIKNETEKASDYLNRFSRLIRLILQNSRAEYVNLKDELEALKLYMEMESLRFDDRFEYVVRVGSGLQLESLEIPPLLLQPYVENAIWHGLAKKTNGKNRLDLTITRENGSLFCRIEDNGIGREAARELKSGSTATHRSMGMYITRDRLQLINRLHQARADVEITDLYDEQGEAAGTRVDIIIPIR